MGRQGDVIEETKPHGPVPFGVVARRAHQAEDVAYLSFKDGVQGDELGPHGFDRCFVRVWTGGGVRIKLHPGLPCRLLDGLYVFRAVVPAEFLKGGLPGFEYLYKIRQIRFRKALVNFDQPFRPFRMIVSRVVF